MTETLLETQGLRAGYGETIILGDPSPAIRPGEARALLGRNGVRKTTLLTTVMGLTTVNSGIRASPAANWPGCHQRRGRGPGAAGTADLSLPHCR